MVAKIPGYHFELWHALLICNFICMLIQYIEQYRYPGYEQFKFNQGRLKQDSSFVLILSN